MVKQKNRQPAAQKPAANPEEAEVAPDEMWGTTKTKAEAASRALVTLTAAHPTNRFWGVRPDGDWIEIAFGNLRSFGPLTGNDTVALNFHSAISMTFEKARSFRSMLDRMLHDAGEDKAPDAGEDKAPAAGEGEASSVDEDETANTGECEAS